MPTAHQRLREIPGVPGMGGGIANQAPGPWKLRNSIISGNRTSGAGPDCLGEVHSNGHNLFRISSGCTITGGTTTDLIGVGALLGPLQVNPPGTTATHALLFSSPAIDTGACSNGLITTDQRGVLRAQGLACDIGAYQVDPTEVWLWFFPLTSVTREERDALLRGRAHQSLNRRPAHHRRRNGHKDQSDEMRWSISPSSMATVARISSMAPRCSWRSLRSGRAGRHAAQPGAQAGAGKLANTGDRQHHCHEQQIETFQEIYLKPNGDKIQ